MKKTLCLILSIIMSLSLLAVSAGAEAATGFEGQTLKVAAFEGGFGSSYWQKICDDFAAAYGVTVELTASPTIDDIVRPQMIAGEYPDIVFFNTADSVLHKEMVKEEAYVDLADVFAGPAIGKDCTLGELIRDGILETTRFDPYHDGRVFLAPVDASVMCLIYNKTLFDENGWTFPTTWDEFFALGDAAKEKGYSLFTYPGIYPTYNTPFVYGALASAIGVENLQKLENYDASGLETEEAKQVFANVAKTVSEYLMPGTTGLNHTQSQSEFMLNKALIISNGDWICGEMADAPMADGFEWAAAPSLKLNEDDTAYYQLSGAGFGIPTAAENQELAKEFVRFFYTDQCQRYMCDAGMVCCTKNFLEVAEDLIPEEKKPFLSLSDSAAGFSLNYVAVDSKLAPETTMFDGLTAIANGDMDAETWRQNTIDVFNRVAAGE